MTEYGSVRRRRDRDLINAVLLRDAAGVARLLAEGASVNARDGEHGETALMLAAQSDRVGLVEALLAAGASVNACDDRGRTALMHARATCIAPLLAAGADIDAADRDGVTALMRATGAADADTVEALLAAGADPARTDGDGESALMRAEQYGFVALAARLLVTLENC